MSRGEGLLPLLAANLHDPVRSSDNQMIWSKSLDSCSIHPGFRGKFEPYHYKTTLRTYDEDHQQTPWIDLAFLTSNTSRCEYIKANSFNQNGKARCVVNGPGSRTYSRAINEVRSNAQIPEPDF